MTIPNPVPVSQRQSLAAVMRTVHGHKPDRADDEAAVAKRAPLAAAVARTNARSKGPAR